MRMHYSYKTPAADQPGRTATPAPCPQAATYRSAVGDAPGGRGQPLAAPVVEGMTAGLGGDFSHVPVYTDSAARAAAAAGALVYTFGPHVGAGDSGAGNDTPAVQRSIGNAAVSRMLERARHQHGAGGAQQQAAPASVQHSAVQDVLHAPGQPLCAPAKEEMEARLGADFSDVRVHTDGAARASAAEMGARAYTSGSHVVIGDRGADKHTLAHELTHVIQQRQGPVAGTGHGSGLKISDPSDRDERAAEAHAAQVMRAPLSEQWLAAAQAGEQRTPIHFTRANPGGRAVARMIAPNQPTTHVQVVNGSQVIDLHKDEHAYAHYTYDVVDIDGGRRRDNEHVTIENSLAALIAILGTDPKDVWRLAEARRGKETTKSTYYQLAQKRGYAGVDNFNFRPEDQGTRPLPGGGAPGGVTPKAASAETIPIERGLSLRHFLNFIGRVFGELKYADAKAVITSIETVTGRMGTNPESLFLNSVQRSDFITFTLIADRAVRAHKAHKAAKDPSEVPVSVPVGPGRSVGPVGSPERNQALHPHRAGVVQEQRGGVPKRTRSRGLQLCRVRRSRRGQVGAV